MRRRAIFISMTAAGLLFVSAIAMGVDKKGTIPELKERLEKTTKSKDRVELAVEIVDRQLDSADKAYADGKMDEGQTDLADVEQYGVMAANESSKSGQRMKQTEIALRKIEDKLDNLARSVDVDYRQPVHDTLRKIDSARNSLLMHMFK